MCFSIHVDQNIEYLANTYKAKINNKAFEYYEKMSLEMPKEFKGFSGQNDDEKIYAKYWTPIIISRNGSKEIRPMRYQLLPNFSSEIKYMRTDHNNKRKEISNTFNARLDSLEKRNAWKKPFMRYHGVVPMRSFYEWVEREEGKQQIKIFPKEQSRFFTPCLFDNWYSEDKKIIIQSFAVITTDPTNDILEMGHDRKPIILNESDLDTWLNPSLHSKDDIYSILKNDKKLSFDYGEIA